MKLTQEAILKQLDDIEYIDGDATIWLQLVWAHLDKRGMFDYETVKGKIKACADMAEHRLPIAVQTEREARVAVFDLPMKAAAAPALRSLAGKAGGFQMNAAEHHAFFPAFSSSILPRIIFSSYRRKRQAPITQVTVAMAATVRYWPASTTASPFTMCLTVTEV